MSHQVDSSPLRTSIVTLVTIVIMSLYVMATLPLQDPSEGRHAVVGQNMLTSGDWITPMTTEDGEATPFLGKPPLQFWLIATSFHLFGHNELASRFPSLLATALSMFVLFRFASRFLTAELGVAAILIHLSTLIGFFFSGACMLDPLLAACVMISVFAIPMGADHYKNGDESEATFWECAGFVALAGGLLCKGPIALVLTIGSLAPWMVIARPWQALRRIHWVRGLSITTALTAPWYLLADLQQPGFLNYFIVHENILRFLVKKYGDMYGSGHRHFRGMIWFMTILACIPWTILGVGLISRVFSRFIQALRRSPKDLFVSCRILPEGILVALGLALFPALFFTASRQVSIYYTLPSIPALALLLAYGISLSWQNHQRLITVTCTGFRVLAVISLPAIAIFSWLHRPELTLLALLLFPLILVALYEIFLLTRGSLKTPSVTIARTAFYLVVLYLSAALLELTDFVGGGSCRDLIKAVVSKENESTISFYQRVPHSASFYGATVGDSIHDRRVEFEEIHDLSLIKELRHPLVIRQKALDKLARQGIVPNFPFDRLSIPEGGWVVLLPKS
jgi:4-amino-4-deoxy-L-arabinose transferase-like glycosyltransferase